jgi:hypothetical protein
MVSKRKSAVRWSNPGIVRGSSTADAKGTKKRRTRPSGAFTRLKKGGPTVITPYIFPRRRALGRRGVSQRFALDFPERVRSLVLVSTSSEVGERATRAWHRLAETVERDGLGPEGRAEPRAVGPAFAAANPEVVRELARRQRTNDPAAYAATARAFGRYDWTANLSRVQAPAQPAARDVSLEMPALFSTAVLAFLAGVDP